MNKTNATANAALLVYLTGSVALTIYITAAIVAGIVA